MPGQKVWGCPEWGHQLPGSREAKAPEAARRHTTSYFLQSFSSFLFNLRGEPKSSSQRFTAHFCLAAACRDVLTSKMVQEKGTLCHRGWVGIETGLPHQPQPYATSERAAWTWPAPRCLGFPVEVLSNCSTLQGCSLGMDTAPTPHS